MSTTATFDDIRAGIVTAIRGITPTYPHYAGACWNHVKSQASVPSSDLRNYFVDLDVPLETGDVFGGCAEHTAELRVWTSYGGLSEAEQQVMVARDHQDLWRSLHRAAIDGAPKYEKAGFEGEADDGRLWGAHVFTVTLFLPLP